MALRARDIIASARFEHPAFDRALAPTSVCVQLLSEGQRRLMLLAHQRNPNYAVQRWLISLLPTQNIAQVGAGTAYGAPIVTGSVDLEARTVNTGSLATTDNDVTVMVAPRAVTNATGTTLTDATQGWTVNAYVGMRVKLLLGVGAGQTRQVVSNTATDLVVDTAWDQVPDASAIYTVEQDVETVDGSAGVAMDFWPQMEARPSYLVRLDASGAPFIDLATPITVKGFLGIPLPPASFIDHGVVRFQDSDQVPDHIEKFELTTLAQQHAYPRGYCGAVVNGALQLFGPVQRWWDAISIELPYLPIPPAVAAGDDLLTLREDATEALVAQVVLGLARRAKVMGRAGADGIADVMARANDQENIWLDTVAGKGRAKVLSTREVW